MTLLYIYLASALFSFVGIVWSVWHDGKDIKFGELVAMFLFSLIPLLAPFVAVLMLVDEITPSADRFFDRTAIKGRKKQQNA